MRRLKLHIVQIRFALHRVGCSDLNRCQIGQNGEESTRRLTWLPLIVMMLVQTERIFPDVMIGHAIALSKDGQRDLAACTLQDHVAGTGVGSNLSDQLQLEFQITIVRGTLIAQEAIGSLEIHELIALRCGANTATILIVLDVHIAAIQIDGSPAFLVLVEAGGDRDHGVARCGLTLGGVTVAEAGCAAKAIALVQIEEARFASRGIRTRLAWVSRGYQLSYLLITTSALNVLLAETDAGLGITGGRVVLRSACIAATGLATVLAKLVEVVAATITLVSGHSRLALALALAVALQRARADRIAAAIDAECVVAHVEVLLAAFTVGAITIVTTVQAVSTVSG